MARPAIGMELAERLARSAEQIGVRATARLYRVAVNTVQKYRRLKEVTYETNSSGSATRRDSVSRGG